MVKQLIMFLFVHRNKLIATPFAPLTQQYQTCRNNPATVFFNQAGVSAGNVSILSPAGVLLVLALLGLYQWCTGRYIPKAYSRGEKDAALSALAEALLLVRDRRIRVLRDDSDCSGSDDYNVENNHEGGDEDSEGTRMNVALLAELVDQLGNVAAVAHHHDLKYKPPVASKQSAENGGNRVSHLQVEMAYVTKHKQPSSMEEGTNHSSSNATSTVAPVTIVQNPLQP